MQERRRFVRIKVKLYIGYKALDPSQLEGHCWSRDISIAGIGLIMKDKMEFGTIMELRIGLQDKLKPLVTKAKVFWQVENPLPHEDGGKCYRTGLIFTSLLEEEKNRLDNFIGGFLRTHNNN
ncbi:MAG: PilZ domain-containing protein [bacterium]